MSQKLGSRQRNFAVSSKREALGNNRTLGKSSLCRELEDRGSRQKGGTRHKMPHHMNVHWSWNGTVRSLTTVSSFAESLRLAHGKENECATLVRPCWPMAATTGEGVCREVRASSRQSVTPVVGRNGHGRPTWYASAAGLVRHTLP